MKLPFKIVLASMSLLSIASCSKNGSYSKSQPESNSAAENLKFDANSDAIVFRAAGDIVPTLAEFQGLLGTLNSKPNAVGGRREVNWDAVPAAFTNNNLFPGDFFGSSDPLAPDGRKRGIISTTPGKGFQISDSNFENVKAEYGKLFKAFSPKKTFIANESTITDNFFKVPGTNVNASVQGFGVVFSGVNNGSSTSMEFYEGDKLLGTFKVPNNGTSNVSGFSFLGVYFPNNKVTRVRINSGSAPLSATQDDLSDGGGKDIVIMDDFIYSEPQN